MFCMATYTSGNYAFSICRFFERRGYVFEVVATPCQIARDGCSYCLKFPAEYTGMVVSESMANNMPVKEVFKLIPMNNRNKYEKVL